MKADLFVYGVPAGADTWKDEDRTYFRTFYDSKCPDKVKFLVQIRASGEKKYCYYNYLLYENVVAFDGRPGSYFGVSLRLDEYCREVVSVYYILEALYRKYVLGNFIKAEAGRLRYAVNNFASVSAVLTNMEKDAGELILKSLDFNKSCVSLNAFPLNGSRYSSYNLYECAIDRIQHDMQQYGQVALSPYYQSHETQVALQQSETRIKDAKQQCQKQIDEVTRQSRQKIEEVEKERDKEITRVKEECEKQKEEISSKLTSAKSEIKKHKQTIDDKESEIKNKEKELARLKDENKRKGQCKSIEEIVASIQKPIKELAKSMQSIAPEEPPGEETQHPTQDDEKSWFVRIWQGFVGFFHKYLNTILLVLILFLLFVQYHTKTAGNTEQEIEKISTEIEQIITEIEQIKTEIVQHPSPKPPVKVDISKVKIDIEPYKGGPLNKVQKYTVRAKNSVTEGTWIVKGGKQKNTDDPNMIYVTPTEDSVEIIYCVGSSSINRILRAG